MLGGGELCASSICIGGRAASGAPFGASINLFPCANSRRPKLSSSPPRLPIGSRPFVLRQGCQRAFPFFFSLEGDAVLLRDQYGALLSNPLSLTYLRRDYRISALNKGTPRPRFFSVFFFVSLLTDYNFGRCFISFLVETFGPILCSRLSRSFGSAFTLSSLESVRVAFDPRAKRLEPFPRSQGSCRRCSLGRAPKNRRRRSTGKAAIDDASIIGSA